MSQQRKHKILFVAPYPFNKAPSQRLKYEQYYDYFREAGFDITTSSFIDDDFWKVVYKHGFILKKILFTLKGYLRRIRDLIFIRRYDVVYIHLWVTPLGLPVYEWLFCLFAKKVVYDIDDLIFLGHSSSANKKSEWLKGKAKAIYLMKNANHVITCTPKLDDFVRQYNQNTSDISSTINTTVYQPKDNHTIHKLVIGWSGSHSTARFVYLLTDVFLELKKEIDFTLLVIGDAEFKMEGIDVKAIAWKADTEVEDLSQMDIGIYPLPDEPWVYGKSGLKALQYMALGIPTIATAIGANFRIINSGQNGFLANSKDEWLAAFRQLLLNQQLRENVGKAARQTVVDKFSLQVNKDTYLNILKGVILNS